MRVLVTGARGKVGRATVAAFAEAGHEVHATDLAPPSWDAPPDDAAWVDRVPYVTCDLTDAGEAFALVGGFSATERGPKGGPYDAVVHAAAIPAPGSHAPHVVFGNNLLGLFNVVEACVRFGVPRLVNLSSETVPGMIFAERPFDPTYLPLDEDHPVTPQDPYALSKHLGEELCDAVVRRSDLRVVSIRPTWVQDETSWSVNIGPFLADRSQENITGWAYVDVRDLASSLVLAAGSDLPGHEVFYIAAADTMGGRDLHASWREAYPDSTTELRPVSRPDASGIDTSKARRLLGWEPRHTWADHLTPDGRPVADA